MSQSIMRSLDHTDAIEYEGEILFEKQDLLSLSHSKLRAVRGDKISMVFRTRLRPLVPCIRLVIKSEKPFVSIRRSPRRKLVNKPLRFCG